jgi:hypothetical protein
MCYLRCEGLAIAATGRLELAYAARLDSEDVRELASAATLLWACADGRPLTRARLLTVILVLQQRFGEPTPEPRHRARISEEDPRPIAWHVEPGELEVLEPPLTLPSHAGRALRRVHAGYSGSFRYPSRAVLPAADGRAFGVRRRIAADTVLVDCSASREATLQPDIAAIRRGAVQATIALYAGAPNDMHRGRLVVVARNGNAADLEGMREWLGDENIVDVPALEWLMHQPSRKIWISDQYCTGRGGKMGRNLLDRAAELVEAGRIECFPTIAAYLGAQRPMPRP